MFCIGRLTVNSFVECLLHMAAFKYPNMEPESSDIMQALIGATNLAELLSNRAVLQGLQDMFLDLCHPGIFDYISQNQIILLKAFRRSANYGVKSTLISPEARPSMTSTGVKAKNIDSGSPIVQSFVYFCKHHMIVPHLTRESVITRISMHLRYLC